MTRNLVSVAVVFLMAAGVGLAQDEKGKGKGKNKGMRVVGTVKKVDAGAGTLTVATRSKKDRTGKDEVFRITDATKVTVFGASADDKKELTGKEGMREIKDGVRIAVMHSEGKVTQVIVNPMPRKKSQT